MNNNPEIFVVSGTDGPCSVIGNIQYFLNTYIYFTPFCNGVYLHKLIFKRHRSSKDSGRVVVIGLFRPVSDKLDPVSLQVMLLKGKTRSFIKAKVTCVTLLVFLRRLV